MSAKCLSTKPIAQWLAASLLINFVANDASWWPASSLPASLIIGVISIKAVESHYFLLYQRCAALSVIGKKNVVLHLTFFICDGLFC